MRRPPPRYFVIVWLAHYASLSMHGILTSTRLLELDTPLQKPDP